MTRPGKIDATDTKTIEAFVKAQNEAMNSSTIVRTKSGFDGGFVANDVAPGDYYLMVSAWGYLQPRDLLQAAYDAGEDVTRGISGVPIVHVSANKSINTEITLTRGAALEGHVLWDDGGAVNEAMVSVEPKTGEHKQLPPQFSFTSMGSGPMALMGVTDDRGRYRISGLAPGEYRVRATLRVTDHVTLERGRLNTNGAFGSMPLIVYAPGSFRKGGAKPVTLAAGEERTDEDITFNLGATHTVNGRVTSAEDHHALNRGIVTLTDSSDKAFVRSAGLDEDGNFSVAFVPSGTYTMTVANAADTVPEEQKPGSTMIVTGVDAVRTYQKSERQVIVTDNDVTGQNIELVPAKNSQGEGQNGSDDSRDVVVGTGH